MTTSVVLVDDHAMVRRALADMLAGHLELEIRGEAGDGEGAVSVILDTNPDVVLMDLSMPGVDGIEATRRLRARGYEGAIVILTSFAERERVLQALDAGADGYLLKDAEPDELIRAVLAAARGEAPLAPRAARALVAERRRSVPTHELTPRERDVLLLLTRGLANKQIAWRLGITEKTVKAHLGSAYARIGVADRTQAALWAREHLTDAS